MLSGPTKLLILIVATLCESYVLSFPVVYKYRLLIKPLMELVEIMKDKNVWQNIYFHDLYDIYCHFNKHNLDNKLLSLIPSEYQKKSVQNFKPLVIVIDGIDEAFVSDQSKRISDWFYTYDDKGNRLEKWTSPDHIKWIFTYRHSVENEKLGYQFEAYEFKTLELKAVQPLEGLTDEEVKNALKEQFKDFEPQLSEDFLQEMKLDQKQKLLY